MSKGNEDKFRILIATDNHIGYCEKDPIRGGDSFRSFEEVLQIAQQQEVDFVLLGGDLFHDNKPSSYCLIRCTELLRKYCLGEGHVSFQLVSDQSKNFDHSKDFPYVNFEEENLNVKMPVFSIHGNHDDPTGKNPRCFLEAISASGLINYFGKHVDMNKIDIHPLLLRKGTCKLALYGLGSLPEERLHRMFQAEKVQFRKPNQEESWFKLMVVHQNRVAHGTKYLPEAFLGSLPDMVLWGHEHECRDLLEFNNETGFYVLQPGSSVATSLCEAEARPKKVFLLTVHKEDGKNKFKTEPIPLKTVRPFKFTTIDLDKKIDDYCISKTDVEGIEKLVEDEINSMIQELEMDESPHPDVKLPLIRLRVDSSFAIPFNIFHFGLRFKDRVANPKDVLLYKVKRAPGMRGLGGEDLDKDTLQRLISDKEGVAHRSNIEDIVTEYFAQTDQKSQLDLLRERLLTISVRDMVEKETPDAITNVIDSLMEDTKDHLMQLDLDPEMRGDIAMAVKAYQEQSNKEDKESDSKLKKLLKQSTHNTKGATSSSRMQSQESGDDIDDDIEMESPPPVVKRGRGRGRGATSSSRGASSSGATKKKSSAAQKEPKGKKFIQSFESDEDSD